MWKSWEENGMRFKRWVDDAPPTVVRKRVAPVTPDEAAAYYVAKGLPYDVAISGLHHVECVEKARVREENRNAVDVARDEKLARQVKRGRELYKLGGHASLSSAIDAAGRELADQHNSGPGQ
jgi:hypothetical protein